MTADKPDWAERLPTEGEKVVAQMIHCQMLLPTADNISGRKLAADLVNAALTGGDDANNT